MNSEDGFQVAHIDHVEVFVADQDAAAAWYERTLGLTPVKGFEHWAAEGGPLMISSDGGRTMLALFKGQGKISDDRAGFRRVAFRVDAAGFRAFHERLATNPVFDHSGHETRQLSVEDHGQSWSVYFCDPWRNQLEVTTYDVER